MNGHVTLSTHVYIHHFSICIYFFFSFRVCLLYISIIIYYEYYVYVIIFRQNEKVKNYQKKNRKKLQKKNQ